MHFSTDNIDILDASLDGKNTFHATQVTAWQRGPAAKTDILQNTQPSHEQLIVPEELTTNIPPKTLVSYPEQKFHDEVQLEWFTEGGDPNPHQVLAEAKDIVFQMKRRTEYPKRGWSQYNQQMSDRDPESTTIGYMPIILSPAHEYDTLNTVIIRCKHVAESLGQPYVVLTADEALFCRLMELKWSQNYTFLFPRLGSLHSSMNFMKVIGQHWDSCGLLELWTESGLLGGKTAERVLAGKDYEKGMRAHKITFQAIWACLLPQLLSYLEEHNKDLNHQIQVADSEEDDLELMTVLVNPAFQKAMHSFITQQGHNPNCAFWFTYLELVSILLLFTRASRDGHWELHLSTFKRMLPYFFRYDHTNYAKWGTVYLAEMNMLPQQVLSEFREGNFVVKVGHGKFNQVDGDHGQEWLNGAGKRGGGIVGITKSITALNRWTLSFNLRSAISMDTKSIYGINLEHSRDHKDTSLSRRRQDTSDEENVIQKIHSFRVLSSETSMELHNIATKDRATNEITESLLNVKYCLGQMTQFVQDRLQHACEEHRGFHDTLKRNNPATFAKLYEIKKTDTQKVTMKADPSVPQRLIIAYAAGRTVNLEEILKHELLPVPLSIAETSGQLRTGTKSILMDALCMNIICAEEYDVPEDATLVIDGQALVMSIGRPQMSHTFEDFATVFLKVVHQYDLPFTRIDVVFDRYDRLSIKEGTRTNRKKGRPICRVIETPDVPLPQDW